jgi:hypothetical protein
MLFIMFGGFIATGIVLSGQRASNLQPPVKSSVFLRDCL